MQNRIKTSFGRQKNASNLHFRRVTQKEQLTHTPLEKDSCATNSHFLRQKQLAELSRWCCTYGGTETKKKGLSKQSARLLGTTFLLIFGSLITRQTVATCMYHCVDSSAFIM